MTDRRADIKLFFNDRHKVRTKMTQRGADIKYFFNTTTDLKSFFQTDLKSTDVVSFLKNR
jgi:hypothetical protein